MADWRTDSWTIFKVNDNATLSPIANAKTIIHLNTALSDFDWEAKFQNERWDYIDASDLPVEPFNWPGQAVEAELRIGGKVKYVAKVDNR